MEMLADQPPDCTSLIEQTRAWPAKEAPLFALISCAGRVGLKFLD